MADRVLVDFPFMEYACYFPSLESLLRYCNEAFLATVSFSADPDQYLTKFQSLFARVLNAYRDPPLEAVWLFAALTFRDDPDDLRSILQLLSAVTASSPAAAKPLALLTPVVSELFHSTKPRRKIEAVVDAVLSYIGICCSRPGPAGGADAGRLLPVFGELVEVWNVRNRGGCPFQLLFPLVGEEAMQDLKKEGCSVTYLAGVVVAEAYLLKLCLKVQGLSAAAGVVPRSERHKNLSIWASSSISEFKNQQFFPVLLNTLVNSPLHVNPLLSADDEILVRDVLYDALIWSDQSVLSTTGAEIDDQADDASLFPFIVSSLFVLVDARRRKRRDQGRAMLSYIKAFSTSNIRRYLTRWATCQAGADQLGKPITTITPEAFLNWLVQLEDKGLCSRIKERLVRHDEGQNGGNHGRISSRSDADLFFIDNKSHLQEGMDTKGGDDEDVEMETADNNTLMAAAHSMKKVMTSGTRKRKDRLTEDATVVKFLNYKAEDSSVIKDYS